MRDPGQTFDIFAATVGRSEFSSKVGFWVDGVKVAEIHTSCSSMLGPGTTEQIQGKDPNGVADFRVISGLDKDNAPLCEITCLECAGGVKILTFQYDGDTPANVKFYNDKDPKVDKLLFDSDVDAGGDLNPGDVFTVSKPLNDDKFSGDVSLWIDDVRNTKIHTSCSKAIGPGIPFGDFIVTAAVSKDNGEVCPVLCTDCGGGVTNMTLRYDGGAAALITVKDDMDTYFNAVVNPGDEFTFHGTKDDNKFQQNNLDVLIGGGVNTTIHVSCSQDVNPGLSFGDFTITAAFSMDKGPVCPIPGFVPSVQAAGPLFGGEGLVLQSEEEPSVPGTFALEANYPNPFNPETRIAFTLPETGPVKLVVYDVVGRKVDTLVGDVLSAGRHEVTWHVGTLPSGVYLYRITAGSYEQVRQMTVLK